jgi:uncharacterized membrane protein
MARCPQCDWPLPEQAQYCSSCGTAIAPEVWNETSAAEATPQATRAAGAGAVASGEPLPIAENVAGVIAYMTIFPAIVFLILEPFKRNRFVRFHSFQHLLLWAAGVGAGIASGIVGAILQLIPFMRVLVFPFTGLIGLAFFFLWVLLVVKAYEHEMFKLPILGDLAEEWANRHS